MVHPCPMFCNCTPTRLAFVTAFAALTLAGCATQSAYEIEPLQPDGPSAGKDRAAGYEREPAPEQPPLSTAAPTVATSEVPSPPDPTSPVQTDPAEAVDDLLARYGRLTGRIAADPAGAPPQGSPLRAEWDSLVEPGSALSTDVLQRFHHRATVDRMVIVAGTGGVTFRHRVARVTDHDAAAVRFEWCGWSPGIVRRIDDGAVVDDSITTSTGTGVVVGRDGAWRLTELEEDERQLLPPGSSDPCADQPQDDNDAQGRP